MNTPAPIFNPEPEGGATTAAMVTVCAAMVRAAAHRTNNRAARARLQQACNVVLEAGRLVASDERRAGVLAHG